MITVTDERIGRSLVSEDLFNRLTRRIVKEHGMTRDLAVRIVDQALAFLGTCALTAEPLAPSSTVDIGWHTFILYTREYAELCSRVAGAFIHHEPTDTGQVVATRTPAESMDVTTAALRDAGFAVDLPLWDASAKCNQCTDGCTHSGGDTGCHHHPVRTDTVSA